MNIQWFPGHMAKARNEIQSNLKLVDIVFVLLDSRIPYSSINPVLDKILKDKPKLFLLTKSSLVDNDKLNLFLKNKFNLTPYLLIDSITRNNINKIEKVTLDILEEKFLSEKNKGMKKRSVRAMIVGIPNVGKSTLINTLVSKKVTTVGNKPGVTKALQWIRINKNLELLDTPGVLWPKFEEKIVGINLALTGAIKSEVILKDDLSLYLLDFYKKEYPNEFVLKYEVNLEIDNIDILNKLIKKFNFKSEEYDKVYDILLNDFKSGKVTKVFLDSYE